MYNGRPNIEKVLMNLYQSLIHSEITSYPAIDWGLLAKASAFYKSKGLTYKETPWTAPIAVHEFTKPHQNPSFIHDLALPQGNELCELVGSAEQGFIYLMLNNELKDGKYYSITPCFRFDTYDKTHQPWFMKAELMHLQKNCNQEQALQNAMNLLDLAWEFLTALAPDERFEKVQTSSLSWDINLNGIEIGSYGVRNVQNIVFAYGTGLALPRFSIAQCA